jgi:hypothetical protein
VTEEAGLEQRIAALEQEIEGIRGRNLRVEAEKAWEVSSLRMVMIAALTYAATAVVFWLIRVEHFLANAIIPCVAYCLSTRTLPVIRRWWLRRNVRG